MRTKKKRTRPSSAIALTNWSFIINSFLISICSKLFSFY
ncbi:hypothetical protein EVA_04117 [gut metagenome]|uniref:Uncharacterized protein n=1 Tax=gut metagenome TaxID=749906 RepID=J9GXF3_9ZZZZ